MEAPIQKAQEFLVRLQSPGGGWPYREGAQPFPEPTCYGLLALAAGSGYEPTENAEEPRGDRSSTQELGGARASTGETPQTRGGHEPTAQSRAIGWLETLVSADGAIVLDGDDDPNWATSHLLLSLTRLGRSEELRGRCAEWLLTLKGEHMEATDEVPFDSELSGWPWMDATFSWVEPTSYALLALKASGYGDHPRVVEAEKMLLDRTCVGGGWNYGNREVLGRELPPFVPTTAMAVMALQGVSGAGQAVGDGLDYLQSEVAAHPSALSLSLAVLAFDIHGRPTGEFARALAARQEADGSWRRAVHLTALATLAIDAAAGGANVFGL